MGGADTAVEYLFEPIPRSLHPSKFVRIACDLYSGVWNRRFRVLWSTGARSGKTHARCWRPAEVPV